MTKQQTSVMRNASIAKEEREGSDNNNVDRSSSDAISDNDAERCNSHSEIDNESNFDMVPYSRFSHKQKCFLSFSAPSQAFFQPWQGLSTIQCLLLLRGNLTSQKS